MRKHSGKQKKLLWRAPFLGVVLLLTALLALLFALLGRVDDLWLFFGIIPRAQVPQVFALDGDMAIQNPVGVHFIDVGQGDAVLLEADGEFALIDAGPAEGKDSLIAYLNAAGVSELRYMIMTHPHADHVGNMQEILKQYRVLEVMLPDLHKAPYPTTKTFVDLLDSMIDAEVYTSVLDEGAVYILGSGTVKVLHNGLPTSDNYNLLSPFLLFEAGGLSYLSGGDAEKPNEQAALESGQSFVADVYKASHHGSSTSNTAKFVQAVCPRIVVISCAKNNSYGHPHRTPLANFAMVKALVLRTDESGSILVRPDGFGGLAVGSHSVA